jgi:hypothetical protein
MKIMMFGFLDPIKITIVLIHLLFEWLPEVPEELYMSGLTVAIRQEWIKEGNAMYIRPFHDCYWYWSNCKPI